jgi:hypothetical protein
MMMLEIHARAAAASARLDDIYRGLRTNQNFENPWNTSETTPCDAKKGT